MRVGSMMLLGGWRPGGREQRALLGRLDLAGVEGRVDSRGSREFELPGLMTLEIGKGPTNLGMTFQDSTWRGRSLVESNTL